MSDNVSYYDLYNALKKDGAVQGDWNSFHKFVGAQGKQGYQNRKKLYDALKADGAIQAKTYEEFNMNLFRGGQASLKAAKQRNTQQTQTPQQPAKPQTAAQKALQMMQPQQSQEPVDYLSRPQNQRGKALGGAPKNASPFVQSLYEEDNAKKGADYPVSYSSPKGIQQVYEQNKRVRKEATKTAADKIANDETRRRNQPIAETKTPADDYVVKTQGQLEDEMQQSAKRMVDANLGDYLDKALDSEFKAAHQRGLDALAANGNGAVHGSGGADWWIGERAYQQQMDADKQLENIVGGIKKNVEAIFSNENVKQKVLDDAASLGVDPEYYIKNQLAPALIEKANDKFSETQLARMMPQGTSDYIAGGILDSMTGTILAGLASTKSQRQMQQQANAMTDEGENPNYKPEMGARVARGTLSFATDAMAFKGAGIGANAATNAVFGNAAKQAARMANANVARRVFTGIGRGVLHGGVTGFQYGAANAVVQNYSTGEDTSLGNTLKQAAIGGVSEAASFAAMEGLGGMVGGLGHKIGLNGTEKGFLQKANKVGQKITYEAVKTGMEGIGMATGGVAASYARHLMTDEDWQGFTVEGTLESCANAVAFKLMHAKDLFKREVDPKTGKQLGIGGSLAMKAARFLSSDAAKSQRFVFTDEEKRQLRVAGEDIDMPYTKNIFGLADKSKGTNPEDAERAEDGSDVLTYYQQIMQDPNVSWDAKAKFSTFVMGTMPESRPMYDHYAVGMENDFDAKGDTITSYNTISEYAADGTLLSKRRYDTRDKRESIIYELKMRGENERLQNTIALVAHNDKNNYELQNAFFAESMKHPEADVERFVTDMGTEGSDVFRNFTNFVTNAENGKVMQTFDAIAKQNAMERKDLIKASNKDPMKRTEAEQNACIQLRHALEDVAFPKDKVHEEQSHLQGKDVAEDNNLGTEKPNGEAVKQELNNLSEAENELEQFIKDNDVFGQNFENLQKQGLTNPQIYAWMLDNGLTQEQLAPFAHYINANARVQGMQNATQQKIEERVSAYVQDWSHHGTLNGQEAKGEQVVYVQDKDGRTLVVGSGDMAFDSTNGRPKEGVGDMLVCLDPNTGDIVYTKVDDVTFFQTQKPEDFGKEYRNKLQQINSQAYNEAAAEQAAKNAEKPSESGKTTDTTTTSLEGDTALSQSEGDGKGTENNPSVQENPELYKVANSLLGKVGGSLSEEEASNLTIEMESRAEKPRDLQLTPDNWYAEFGEEGKVATPLGEVKMGENQVSKLFEKGRSKEFGMIKPTLETPDAIIEVPSSAADGNEERSSSYLFVKTFLGKNGEKVYYFKSVTVKKDGMEISISSHYDRAKRVREALEKGKLLYLKGGGAQTEQNQPSVSGATSEEVSAGSSVGKDTNNSSNGNGSEATLTFKDGNPVPMTTDSKGRPTPDYGKMTAEQAAEVMTQQFGEDAEKVADAQIKKAEKALKDAEKMKVNYNAEPNDILEQKQIKKTAIAAANEQLEKAQGVKKALTAQKVAETMKPKENETPVEGAHEAGSVPAQKFQSATRLVGNKRTRMLADGKTKIRGHYEIVPAESLTPSHDVNNGYKMSEGFPVDENGHTINDRDYENDKTAQLTTDQMALKYNGQAIEQVPVVSDEGIVYDGNGRTMAGQKAAKNGTDKEYIDDLLENAENFGFTREQIEQSGIEHPRVVLVTDERLPYDTATFAKFNRNEKKAQSNTEQAVAKAKTLTPDEIGAIVADIEGNGSLEVFFNNANAINSLVKTLQEKGVIGQNEVAGFMDSPERLSAQGKEFVKNLLLGAIFKPETIRMLGIEPSLKNKAINGIRTIMENVKLGDYALMDEIDHAIQLLYEARNNGMTVEDLLRQGSVFEENARDRFSPIEQAIAQTLEGSGPTLFRDLMREYNDIAKHYNTGEADMFGEHLSHEELVKQFLEVSKTIKNNNIKLYGNESRHSEQEGGNHAASNEEPAKEAGGTVGTEGSEPTESQERVTEALKHIATEITKQTGVEVVTDEKAGQSALEEAEATDSNIKYHKETDQDVLDELNNGETIKVYRAMQVIDGKLYPPMAASVDGKLVEANELGTWIRADENPNLAIPDIDPKTGQQKVDKKTGELKWKFKLDKGGKDATGKKATDVNAAYNPYWHMSRSPLNDQFKSAWIRPNIVVVECEVPVSELTSGYKAERAKDAVGEVDWKSGSVSGEVFKQTGRARKVILSRWCKPVRVLDDAEVAQRAKEFVGEAKVEIPENVLTPKQRIAFEEAGFKIGAPEKGVKKSEQIQEALKKGLQVDNTVIGDRKQFRGKDGEVYGFTDGEKIYLDTKKMKPETPLHEYTHLWTAALKRANPKEWENVKKLFDEVEGLKEEVSKLYPELKGDDLYEEMITTYSGREGAKNLEDTVRELAANAGDSVEKAAKSKTFIEKVKTALKTYWKGVADMLNIHFTSAEEVADKVLADWAKGVNPKDVKGEEKRYTEALERERNTIIRRAKENGSFMKAPNGEKTNLDEESWVTVRTKEFKEWFGDWENDPTNASKIVDENGEPLIVYHGSRYKNDSTKEGDWSNNTLEYATYFAPYNYANDPYKYAAFLNIRNPLYEHHDFSEEAIQERDFFDKYVAQKGYDGVIGGETEEIKDSKSLLEAREIVATSPNQVKVVGDVDSTQIIDRQGYRERKASHELAKDPVEIKEKEKVKVRYDEKTDNWEGVPGKVISDGKPDKYGDIHGFTSNPHIDVFHNTKTHQTIVRSYVVDEQAETTDRIRQVLEKEGYDVIVGGEGEYIDFDNYAEAEAFVNHVKEIEKAVHATSEPSKDPIEGLVSELINRALEDSYIKESAYNWDTDKEMQWVANELKDILKGDKEQFDKIANDTVLFGKIVHAIHSAAWDVRNDEVTKKGKKPIPLMPKTAKPDPKFNPIEAAAEDYKKEHPMTEDEIRNSTAFDGLPEDQKQYCIDAAIDYLNGEDTSSTSEAYYRNAYAKRAKVEPKKEKTETSVDSTEGFENATDGHEKPKKTKSATERVKEILQTPKGEKPKTTSRKELEAERDAADNEFEAFMKELRKKRSEQLNSGFFDQNLIEAAPKMFSLAAKCAYSRIKLGMYDAKEVVRDLRSRFKEAFEGYDKRDVEKFYSEIMNQKWRDGDKRMSLNDWTEHYRKLSPEYKEKLEGDSKDAEERKANEDKFISNIGAKLLTRQKIEGIKQLRQIAKECGLDNVKDTDLQELAESAVVRIARGISGSNAMSEAQKFETIKNLYENQPSLNQRDSERVMKQQYSTPAPYAFLADMYVKGNGKEVRSALEPSAGNGMLTIGLPMDAVHVNDIDAQRLANLRRQGFKNVTSQDGTQPFTDKDVDVVVTNPPFGSATPKEYDGYKISSLEGQMAINALESMKNDGRAAIIIGGKTEYAKNGSLNPKDKAFLGYLYSHYNVEDVINVNGSLYAKQGTTYPTRIILINGRRLDENAFPPVKSKARAEAVKDYDELYKRINDDILRSERMDSSIGEGKGSARPESDKPSPANSPKERLRVEQSRGSERKTKDGLGGISDESPIRVPGDELGGERGTERVSNDGLHNGDTGTDTAGTESTQGKRRGNNADRHGIGGGVHQPVGAGRNDTQHDANGSSGVLERKPAQKRTLTSEKVDYSPKSKNPFTLQSVMPADQQEAVNKNLEKLGDADQFLVDELGYNDKDDLYAHLAAEQVDSVALALQQAKKGNAFIIGDMTGIGKGRQAASLIRYAKRQGQIPVYFTKTAGLLSDVYRDLVDIGSPDLRPFVLASAKEANITDGDGNLVCKVPSDKEKERVLDYITKHGKLPKEYDYILTTYSQVSDGIYEFDENGNRKTKKKLKDKQPSSGAINGQRRRDSIEKLMESCYLILDESHTAGGNSGQGNYFQHIIQKAKNVTFFSATFAKRSDNMPIYALRTAMNQAGMKASELIDAVKRGGATLQEIMSQTLTQCGQMIRRERDMTGVTIDWRAIEDPEVIQEQREQYDSIIGLFNDIINFQKTYVNDYISKRNDELAAIQSSIGIKRGTEALGIKNVPFASKAFNTVQQVLLSLKAKSTAERAIDYLKQGMKPVIALNNTNESQTGEIKAGEEMDAPDLGSSLKKGLAGTLRYTAKNAKDESNSSSIKLEDLGEDAINAYYELEKKIEQSSTGLSLSPIDVIKNELQKAGYKVGELTGRSYEFIYNDNGTVTKAKRTDTDKKKLAREFNNGQIDALILNKSAATGISLHASSKFGDQRKRVMIVAQQQLDVNDEVQMRGRIDRTGQVTRGAYEYVVSQIPAEQRLLMMFKAKLKSLDANTTSSQKSDFNKMEVADITNKYGDKVVKEYMAEHLDLYSRMADPFGWEGKDGDRDLYSIDPQKLINSSNGKDYEDGRAASKLLGRMALLKVSEQEQMLKEIGELYAAEIQRLNEMGENDLEITELPLKAKTIGKEIWKEGAEPGGDNAFADNTYIEKVNMAILKKPMKAEEVKKAQNGLTGGRDWSEYRDEKKAVVKKYFNERISTESQRYEERAVKIATKAKEKYLKDAKKGQKSSGMSDEQIERMAGYQYDNFYEQEKKQQEAAVKTLKDRAGMFERVLDTFDTNSVYVLPVDMSNPNELSGFGNSYGKLIDIKITDNLSPNASSVSFATLDGRRKVTFPITGKVGSGENKADVIAIIDRLTKQASFMNSDKRLQVLRMKEENWNELMGNESRKDGYIITGNLMQALIDTKQQGVGGQLVKYTTDTGEVKTGILMPERFEPKSLSNEVPISSMADKFDMPTYKGGVDEVVSSDGSIKIKQTYNPMLGRMSYEIRVPKSKAKGGKFFLDKDLMSMMNGNNFESRGNTMLGEFKKEQLRPVLARLSNLGVKVKEERKTSENGGTHFRMELGKTFSDTKENFDGVRDRAVEEKGIVMPNLNKESVKVVPVESRSFGENKAEALKNAREWAKENVATKQGEDMPTMRDGTPYTISKAAIDKYLSNSAISKSEDPFVHLSVLPRLTDVIHESIEAEIHPDYNKGEDDTRSVENGYGDNILIHRLYGAVELDGKTYRVKTTMQEFRGGEENKPHSYEVTKIELLSSPGKRENPDRPPLVSPSNSKNELPDTPGTAVLPDSSPLDMTPSNSISAAKLLNGVEKSYDSGKKLLDESKDLTDGETSFRNSDNNSPSVKLSDKAPAVVKHIADVAKKVGGKVNMVQSIGEITNKRAKAAIEAGKSVTGWYDEKTGEVHLYMPNIHDRYTAEKTIWHEVVGHKGMRELFGEDRFDKFLRSIWYDLDKPENASLKKLVDEERRKNPLNIYDAIEEGVARLAEEGRGDAGFWQNIKNKVVDFLHEIGYRVAPNTKDVKYLLWLSKNLQKNPNDPYYKMRAEAVKYHIDHEDVPAVTERGGMFHDNTGRIYNDMSELPKAEYQEMTDGKVHFRTTPSAGTALDRYDRALNAHGYMATESFMDNMLSLKELMKAVDPNIKKIEDVKSSENPYMLQNTMQGAMSDAAQMFERNVMQPLDKAMADVLDAFEGKKDNDKIRNFNLYMITKHGLERNRVFFVRDYIGSMEKADAEILQKQWDAEKKDLGDKLRNGQIRLDEYYKDMDEWIRNNVDKDFDASEYDYSGMHGVQEIADTKAPYDDAAAIQSVMDSEASMESTKAGSVKDFWSKVNKATSYSLYCDYANGFQSRETYTKTSQMFDWYVPLRKFDEVTAEDVYGYVTEKGDPSGYLGSVLMSAKGRKSLSEVNVLAQIGAMGNMAISNGGKNAVKQAFMRFARSHNSEGLITEGEVWLVKDGTNADGSDRWVEAYPQIPDGAAPKTVSNAIRQFEADMKAKQATGDAKIMRNAAEIGYKFERAKDKSQHVVDVKVNGKTHRFYINGNPRAAQALNGMLENKGSKYLKPLSSVTRTMAQLCTSFSPEFVVRNIVRDAQFASSNVTAKEGARYGAKWAEYYAKMLPIGAKNISIGDIKGSTGLGLYAKYRNGSLDMNNKIHKYFKEFMENGGETGWVQVLSMKEWEKKYKRDIKTERSKLDKGGKAIKDFFFGNLENLNEAAENMARFATYCTSRDYGRSAVRSAYDAKEVSTNFNRHGSGDRVWSFKNGEMSGFEKARRNTYGFVASYLRQCSMFFNAGIQSTNLLKQNVKAAPKGTITAMMGTPFALGALAALVNNWMIANEDEKDRNGVKDPYAELPDYIRRNDLCIYKGGGEFITIPLAIELRAFYGLGDLAAGMTFADNIKSTREPWMDAVGCVSQLVPVMDYTNSHAVDKDPINETVKAFSPSAISPFVEWVLNSDWKGAPIRRETTSYNEYAPAWQRAYKNTPQMFMNLNKKVNAATNDVAPGNEDMLGNGFWDAVTNPAGLNHYLGGFGGGAATFGTRVAKLATADKVETNDIPFLRSFLYKPNEQSSMQRTKSKWYNYVGGMEKTMSNLDRLKSKNVPIDKRLENIGAYYKFRDSKEAQMADIIERAQEYMKKWKQMRDKSSDATAIDNANKNIDLIMQEAVEQLDKLQ